jgi:hypothetical protein
VGIVAGGGSAEKRTKPRKWLPGHRKVLSIGYAGRPRAGPI